MRLPVKINNAGDLVSISKCFDLHLICDSVTNLLLEEAKLTSMDKLTLIATKTRHLKSFKVRVTEEHDCCGKCFICPRIYKRGEEVFYGVVLYSEAQTQILKLIRRWKGHNSDITFYISLVESQ